MLWWSVSLIWFAQRTLAPQRSPRRTSSPPGWTGRTLLIKNQKGHLLHRQRSSCPPPSFRRWPAVRFLSTAQDAAAPLTLCRRWPCVLENEPAAQRSMGPSGGCEQVKGGAYQEPAANLWQAELHLPWIHHWSLKLKLTPVIQGNGPSTLA